MTEKTVRLTGTTLEDDAGCPRQDNIAHLKIGDELKGSVESKYDDDFNETKWVVIKDEDDAEIGDIRGLDSDLIIEQSQWCPRYLRCLHSSGSLRQCGGQTCRAAGEKLYHHQHHPHPGGKAQTLWQSPDHSEHWPNAGRSDQASQRRHQCWRHV